MSDSSFKFHELQTLFGLLDVQVESYTLLVEMSNNNPDEVKFMKGELTKMKSLKTKINKIIKDY